MNELVIGFRSYAVDEGQLFPLFYKYEDWSGDATDIAMMGQPAPVHLFDWTKSDEDPEMGDIDNWVPSILPHPFDEMINHHDDGTDKGLYSFKTLDHAIGYVSGFGWVRSTQETVTAKVQLAGVIVEHENGYRSSMTRILELFHPGNEDERATLASQIGWPFEVQSL